MKADSYGPKVEKGEKAMKKEYKTPEIEIIRMAQVDIITTSDPGDNNDDFGSLFE